MSTNFFLSVHRSKARYFLYYETKERQHILSLAKLLPFISCLLTNHFIVSDRHVCVINV